MPLSPRFLWLALGLSLLPTKDGRAKVASVILLEDTKGPVASAFLAAPWSHEINLLYPSAPRRVIEAPFPLRGLLGRGTRLLGVGQACLFAPTFHVLHPAKGLPFERRSIPPPPFSSVVPPARTPLLWQRRGWGWIFDTGRPPSTALSQRAARVRARRGWIFDTGRPPSTAPNHDFQRPWNVACLADDQSKILDATFADLDGKGAFDLVVLVEGPSPAKLQTPVSAASQPAKLQTPVSAASQPAKLQTPGFTRLWWLKGEEASAHPLKIERMREPFSIDSGDVDGDGREEILLGVRTEAYFDRKKRRRLWLYHLHPSERGLAPFWRGTRFSMPWEDAVVARTPKGTSGALVVLERMPTGRKRLCFYTWRYFGFRCTDQRLVASDTSRLLALGRGKERRVFASSSEGSEAGARRLLEKQPSLIFLGDAMLAPPLKEPRQDQTKAFGKLFGGSSVIVNLESPLGPCLPDGRPQTPRLCADQTKLLALSKLPIAAVTLANNHLLDAGPEGLQATRETLERLGIRVSRPLDAKTHGDAKTRRKEALLPAFCQGTEAIQTVTFWEGGLRVRIVAFLLIHPILKTPFFPKLPTPKEIQACVAAFRGEGLLVASLHGGREYSREPGEEERLAFEAALAGGASVVIGHHPHVTRAFERRPQGVVAWGLGNAISPQAWLPSLRKGRALRIWLSKSATRALGQADVLDFSINDGWPRTSSEQ